jgi:hypothetical protein
MTDIAHKVWTRRAWLLWSAATLVAFTVKPSNLLGFVWNPYSATRIPAVDLDLLYERSMKEGLNAWDEQKYADAEQAFHRALGIVEQFGDGHPGYPSTLRALSMVYAEQARYPEAERLSRQILVWVQKYPNVPSEGFHSASYSLAQHCHGAGKQVEADRILRHAFGCGVAVWGSGGCTPLQRISPPTILSISILTI